MANSIIVQFSETEFKDLLKSCINETLSSSSITKPGPENSLFNVTEASDFLDLAPQTLYGYTSNRTIPFIKKGKKIYFRKLDLEKWLSDGRKLTKDEILTAAAKKEKGGKNG